jgi:hypothetical protein
MEATLLVGDENACDEAEEVMGEMYSHDESSSPKTR